MKNFRFTHTGLRFLPVAGNKSKRNPTPSCSNFNGSVARGSKAIKTTGKLPIAKTPPRYRFLARR